jgi:small subunit ribosomal protein S6
MPKTTKAAKKSKTAAKAVIVADLRPYELTLVVASSVKAEKRSPILAAINKKIMGLGGLVKTTNEWGLKDLAYPIAKQMSGWYAHLNIEIPADAVAKLDKELRENEKLVRHLIVKI